MLVNTYQPARQGETSRVIAFAHFHGVNTPPGETSDNHLDIGVGDVHTIGPPEPMGASFNTPAVGGERGASSRLMLVYHFLLLLLWPRVGNDGSGTSSLGPHYP